MSVNYHVRVFGCSEHFLKGKTRGKKFPSSDLEEVVSL